MALKKLVISCGGTGGHFFPGLSTARVFREQGGEVLLLLSGVHAPAQREIAAGYGIEAVALPEMPHYRRHPIRFLRGFFGGLSEAKRRIRRFGAQAVLGMGSFATLPVMLAALRCKVPVFLHDGNARIGKANRLFSRFARFVAVAFPAVNGSACHCRVWEAGMPLRPEMRGFSAADRKSAIDAVNREFGTAFSPDLPIILVTGGSQGAAVFNTVLPEALCRAGSGFQVIHLAGKGKTADAGRIYGQAAFPHLLLESTGRMGEVLAAADLVFSRSGGSTIAELALFGRAAVLVPYPYAAEGHQLDNARCFADRQAAKLVENRELTVERAEALIRDFLLHPREWSAMGERMRQLARPDAAEVLIAEISSESD